MTAVKIPASPRPTWIEVSSIATNTPPSGPSDLDAVIVGDTPSGDFEDYAHHIAQYRDGASGASWRFTDPQPGLVVYYTETGELYVYEGADGWSPTGVAFAGDADDIAEAAETTADSSVRLESLEQRVSLLVALLAGYGFDLPDEVMEETCL